MTRTSTKDPTGLGTDRLAYSVAEAANALSISRSRIYELVATGEVGICKIGKRTVIPAIELTDFLDRHRVADPRAAIAAR
jgi:excisionase family DNA binding protein